MMKSVSGKTGKTNRALGKQVRTVLASLKRLASKRIRDEMGPRYGVHTDKAFGVPVGAMQKLAKSFGRNHELAAALWNTGWYEARMVAAFMDEPERVTPAQMDRWCRDFDNWGLCDTVCFHLFDRTPHAFAKVAQCSRRNDEFGKRAAFALLACLALHDKRADDEAFLRCLPLIERAAADDRNFVKKGVSWALRLIGRRNAALNAAAVALAQRLSASPHPAARWVGMGAVRELTSPAVTRRFRSRRRTMAAP
jgi:3-methyladenine DNA glycosylase AlkD